MLGSHLKVGSIAGWGENAMTSGSERSTRKKWAKHLGSTTLLAGVLATGQPATANPVISDIINRAMARAATTASRREDAEMPAALILAPAGHGGEIVLAGHSSHSSHKSHSSHRSATTRETSAVPDTTTNVTTKPDDKHITLKDGSQIIARVTFNGNKALLTGKYCQIEVPKEIVKKIKPVPQTLDLQQLTTGRYIVIFKRGNELRADVEKHESSLRLITGSKSRLVPKDSVEKLIRLQEPIQEFGADEEFYCVVTLRDGSKLRGKASLDKNTQQYTLRSRYAAVTLKKDAVFCFEKVENVFVNNHAPQKSPSNADTADTKQE